MLTRVLVSLCVSLSLAIGGVVATSAPASAAISVDTFVANNNGRQLANAQGTYPGECVSLVSQYLLQVHGITTGAWGNAVDYRSGGSGGNRLQGLGFSWSSAQDFQNGDILVWGAGAYTSSLGHIAVWYNGKIFDQNWAGRRTAALDPFFASGYLGRWRKPAPTSPLSDGQLISFAGNVYRIAGGAPLYVSSYDHIGGPQPTTAISQAQFDSLRRYPADGTLISGQAPGNPEHGTVFRIAGGAPVYVSSFDHIGGGAGTIPVDLSAIHNAGQPGVWDHLRWYPADGTLISGQAPGNPQHGTVFRIAGGAPVYVSDYAHIGGDPGTVPVDLSAIHNAGSGGVWNHLRYRPADGTLVSGWWPGHPDAGSVYVIAGGAPVYVSSWAASGGDPGTTVGIDLAAITTAGGGAQWDHLLYRPADGTVLTTPGAAYRVDSGIARPIASGTSGTRVDPAAIANAGGSGPWSHLLAIPSPPPTSPTPGPAPTPGATPTADPTPAPVPTAPPTAADPAPVRRLVISARTVRNGSRVRIDIGPDSATHNYRFTVERRVRGRWTNVYRGHTVGRRDVRVLTGARGAYRVVAPSQFGYAGASSAFRLRG